MPSERAEVATVTLYCSFCGKSEHEVEHMIHDTNRKVGICRECVELCDDIYADYRAKRQLFVQEDW